MSVYTCADITSSVKCNLLWKPMNVSVKGNSFLRKSFFHCRLEHFVYTITGSPSNVVIVVEEPIVFVHGGPGNTHDYMLPMQGLACNGGRRVIFYDQMGAGKSYRPANLSDTPWLLDPMYYVRFEFQGIRVTVITSF